MSAASRGGTAVSALLRNSQRLCSRCARTQPRPFALPLIPTRRLTEAAAIPSSSVPPPSAEPPSSETTTPPNPFPVLPAPDYRILSGIILSRPPLLTRDPTPFESAFYLYQKRLNERLAVPFQKGLYFRKDTASELDWRIKVRERHGVPAKDIGRYNPRGRTAWNDEVLTGSPLAQQEETRERLLQDAEMRVSEDGEEIAEEERVPVERPMGRRTEADEKGDVKRLDRALERTLYLVVKGKDGKWRFPEGDVPTQEALHETATRVLAESAGVNMNTWIVGRTPIAHHIVEPTFGEGEDAKSSPEKRGQKIFFVKGRIMAGQADLTGNKFGLTDFKWLTKEELKEMLPHEYWHSVRNMVEIR